MKGFTQMPAVVSVDGRAHVSSSQGSRSARSLRDFLLRATLVFLLAASLLLALFFLLISPAAVSQARANPIFTAATPQVHGDTPIYSSNPYCYDGGTKALTPTSNGFSPSSALDAGDVRGIALGDLDDDGNLDIVFAAFDRPSQVYLNDKDGSGQFTLEAKIGGDQATSVALGDVNHDGRLDIAMGRQSRGSEIYVNEGKGTFTLTALPDSGSQTTSVAMGDFNNDSALDIVLGNEDGPSQLYFNDGVGGFTLAATLGGGRTKSVGVGDLDGDGFLDIVLGNYESPSQVYFNNGNGDLTPGPSIGGDTTTSVAVGDLNSDGLLDLVLGNEDPNPNQVRGDWHPSQVYMNNGDKGFTLLATLLNPLNREELTSAQTRSVAIGDMNGDGALDIVLGNYWSWGNSAAEIYLNADSVTSNTFVYTQNPLTGVNTNVVAIGDLNRDGALDMVLGDSAVGRVYLNNGATQFMLAPHRLGPFGTGIVNSKNMEAAAVGDLNGDGALDIVLGYRGGCGGTHQIYFNDGAGNFDSPTPLGSTGTYAVALGDLDGNSALDIVIKEKFRTTIYLNDGTGRFASAGTIGSGDTRAIAIGDLNRDQKLDIVLGSYDRPSEVYFNDGKGAFTLAQQIGSDRDRTDAVAFGDLNADGTLDIVLGNDATPSQIYLNDGAGGFALAGFLGSGTTQGVAIGDLNGDGLLDVALNNTTTIGQIYFNNGRGGFTTGPNLGGGDLIGGRHLALGDLNGDGALDVVLGTGIQSHVYQNNGAGAFTKVRVIGNRDQKGIALGDLNGDGTLDIVMAQWTDPAVFYLNGAGQTARLPNNPPHVTVSRPGSARNADLYSAPRILSDGVISLTYTLSDLEGDPVRFVRAYYSLDGGGRWHTATAMSGTLLSDLPTSLDSAVRFDGVDDYVEVPHSSNLNPLNELTLEAWVKLDDASRNQKIVGKTPIGSGYLLGVADNQLYSEIWDTNGTNHVVLAGNLPSKQWTHLAITWRSGDSMIGYVNGVPVKSIPTSVNAISANTDALRIGTSPWLNGYSVRGMVKDVRLYKRTLSAAEIRAEMHQPLPGSEPGLVANWRLDEGMGTFIRDRTANHNDGKLVNGPTWVPGSITYTYNWDTFASGFFGQSDDVVFRIQAYPSYRPMTGTVPGPYQRPYASAQTFPFRVRGTRVQVFSNTVPTSNTLSETLVFRLPADKERGATPLGGVEEPFRTATSGYLPGRAEIKAGKTVTDSDKLIAVWPAAEVSDVTPTRLYASSETFPMTATAGSPIQSRLVISDARRIANIQVWADISATVPIALNLVPPRGDRVAVLNGDLPPGEGTATWRIFTPTLPTAMNPLADGAWTLEVSTALTEPVQLRGWGLALKLSPLNYTSAAPVAGGLDVYPVTTGGVQTLTVSSKNPLLLFDLNVALEWNAVNDEYYQAQLSADLRRASELLYDWTNGQVALGSVRVYHDARRNTLPDGTSAWNNAHIRIYASNRLRPNADQGGVISEPFTETVQIDNATRSIGYLPGQVRMGATWNRYGDATTGNLGDDWPAAFAHELGHYLLFLDDNYLTLKDNLLAPLRDEDCQGAMNNPYSNVYSEFHPDQGWETTRCKDTLSELNTGRPDWQTIQRFYPEVITPTGVFTSVLSGPSVLPLAVTQVHWMAQALDQSGTAVITSTAPLEVPIFYLKSAKPGDTYEASSQARAFLFQGVPYPAVIDLGQPGKDQIYARGARPLDWLCVYDPPQDLVGCKDVVAGDDQILMQLSSDWKPQLLITPVTTRTLQISVTLPFAADGKELKQSARLYPTDAPALPPISLTRTKTDSQVVYSGIITTTEPVLEGYVWVGNPDDTLDPHQAIAEFAIGGNPVRIWALRSPTDPHNVRIRALRVRIRALRAPAASADGQVMVYPDEEKLPLDKEWSFTLQPATRLPAELPWATPVGRAYWLSASENITNFGNSSITFEYLRSDVPAGLEAFMHMYFWHEAARIWEPLEGQRNYPEYNLISAQLRGPGLYALFSHYEIPLQPGWNLIGYPVQGTRPVSEALASIAGQYSLVYGFDDKSTADDPWSVYVPDENTWMNDLEEFRFGHGYWIYVNKNILPDGTTWLLKGNPETTQPLTTTMAATTLRNPPAVYFGAINGEQAEPGMIVRAYIGASLCGEGKIDEKRRYVVKVRAASAQEIGCGTPGAPISFRVMTSKGEQPAVAAVDTGWDNEAPHQADLLISANCRELVRNGAFEAGTAWIRTVTDNRGRVLQRDAAHGRSLLLGVLPGEATPRRLTYSTASQNDILLPADASIITLSFLAQTDDGARGRRVQVYRRSWTSPPLLTASVATSPGWRTVTMDLTSLKGRFVHLYFEVANTSSRPTRWMAVDNVSIQACEQRE